MGKTCGGEIRKWTIWGLAVNGEVHIKVGFETLQIGIVQVDTIFVSFTEHFGADVYSGLSLDV